MARGGLCGSCGGSRRGSQARAASPVATCAECNQPVCERHVRWDTASQRDVCASCSRRLGLKVISRK